MNNNKKTKKPSVLSIILIAILIGFFVWFFVSIFSNRVTLISYTDFENKLMLASSSTNDKIYFSSILLDKKYGNISAVFVNDSIIEKFTVSIPSSENSGYDNVINWFSYGGIYYDALAKSGTNGKFGVGYITSPNPFIQFFWVFGPILLMAGLFLWLYRAQTKGGSGGIFSPGKNQAQRIKSNKKFKDIAGNKESIEEVEELVDYLKNPKKYEVAGARIPKGILLGGPPGTGKTLLAKATAGEASVPFYFISASSFVEMFVGVGAKRVREMFKEARQNAPAIIFIDELDAVGRSRGAGLGGGNDEREQTLNQLLVEMDGITENGGVLIMAATNRLDVLDPALLRPGRFDRTITVALPDIKERKEILQLHAKGKRIGKDVSFTQIAKRTPGYSGAQLENVINEASLLSVREKTGVITTEQIDEAIDRVMSGPAKKNRVISKEELKMVAYHEAGHAVVGIKIPGGNKVQKITIIPRGEAGGYNLMLPEKEKYNKSKSELIAMIKSYMGGRAAEQIIYGNGEVSTGASDDISRATSIARRMVTEWGMSELGPIKYEEPQGSPFLGRDYAKKSFSDVLGHEIDVEVRKLILEAEKEAKKAIEANLDLLELIKDLLLEQETIVGEEIEYIAEHMKLPPKKEETSKSETDDIDLDALISEVESNKVDDGEDIKASSSTAKRNTKSKTPNLSVKKSKVNNKKTDKKTKEKNKNQDKKEK